MSLSFLTTELCQCTRGFQDEQNESKLYVIVVSNKIALRVSARVPR